MCGMVTIRRRLLTPPVARRAHLCRARDESWISGSTPRRAQDATQLALVGDDHVLETLAPNGADQALGVGVLPG